MSESMLVPLLGESVGTKQAPVSAEDASRLAAYLRAHPEAFSESAADLAKRFGLPKSFVVSVLHSLEPQKEARPDSLESAKSFLSRTLYVLRLMFRRLTVDPLMFIGVTAAVAIGLFLIYNYQFGSGPNLLRSVEDGDLRVDLGGSAIAFISISFATLVLHQACYFRHGMIRIALLGSVLCWVISSSTLIVIAWFRLREVAGDQMTVILLLLAFLMFALCGMYAMLSTAVTIIGGTYWVRRREEEKQQRDRQELIEHLFDLQSRLQEQERPDVEPPSAWRVWLDRLSPRAFAVAIISGLLYSAIEISVVVAFAVVTGVDRYQTSILFQVTWFAIKFLEITLLAGSAFLGRGLVRALIAAVIFEACTIPLTAIPVQPFGWQHVQDMLSTQGLLTMAASSLIVGGLAAMGSRIESRAALDRRLHANDPAAVLAEIVKTEWQLALQSRDVCVLVVDVARSSQMKANANPLKVEYSFRAYQRLVARCSLQFSGTVHSTAGDGAVVYFNQCSDAFAAAECMLHQMPEFNRTQNKLDSPFRVRIGLHVGSVAGDINDVQFSEVIDIAAYVEAASPIDGIAMTQPVAEQLPAVRVQPLEGRIMGFAAYKADIQVT